MKSKEGYSKIDKAKFSKSENFGDTLYSKEFSDGLEFKVLSNPEGELRVVLDKKGKEVLDFSTLLPSGWKFISKDYLYSNKEEYGNGARWLEWLTDHEKNRIQVGKFSSEKDILSMLHEIGHVLNNDPADLKKYDPTKAYDITNKKDQLNYIKSVKEQAKILSKIEREAWAYGLKLLRHLRDKFGLDIEEIFSDPKEIKGFVNGNLASYRRNFNVAFSDQFEDDNFEEELNGLFDRK